MAAFPARMVSLIISDIPGDDPALVASGPTLATTSTSGDAMAILKRYAIEPGAGLQEVLERGTSHAPPPQDSRLAKNSHRVIASAWDGLAAAARVASHEGLECHILGDSLEGEARDLAKVLAGMTHSIAKRGAPFSAPCVLLSGGEATVTLKSDGRGGRNTEFVLALALELQQMPLAARVHALSAGTDGLDGQSGAAGAWTSPDSIARARELGLSAREALDRNDSGTFFDRLGSLVRTGPTHTNVNDFRAILVEPA